jgi:micrococcal nuclease
MKTKNTFKIFAAFILIFFTLIQGQSGDDFQDAAFESEIQTETASYPDAYSPPRNLAASDDEALLHGPYRVVRVVDGDTVILEIDGSRERVRLIGIDTPESVHPDPEKNVPYGAVAADYTTSMLEGRVVELELDVQERDRYGRLLAYVFLDGDMVNAGLLMEGHATVTTYPPNVKYVEWFVQLQEQAREAGKGLWAE